MELKEAREQVIEMGKTLLRSGLLVRTWGNISCRINDHQFVITPSGRDYTTLTPEEIVIVNIINEKHWGNIVPSVETGVHRDVYLLRPQVNAVIHTHQTQASVLSAMDMELPTRYCSQFRGSVRCAAYGFPGSDVLRENIRTELLNTTGNALLMSHHGALCVGESLNDAFRYGFILERSAEQFFMEACQRSFAEEWSPNQFIYSKVFQSLGKVFPEEIFLLGKAYRNDGDIVMEDDMSLGNQVKTRTDACLSQSIFEAIFAARPDIHYIRQVYSPEVLTYSVLEQDLETYIDDFAQINGTVMRCAAPDGEELVKALGENGGVLLHGCGALCCGNTLDDVEALALVCEKNAHAWLISRFFEGNEIKAVPQKECEKMRQFYLENYSKRFHKQKEK